MWITEPVVAKLLGLDVSEIEKLAKMSQTEREHATS